MRYRLLAHRGRKNFASIMSAFEKRTDSAERQIWAQISRDLSWPKAERRLWAIEMSKRTFRPVVSDRR
jgi:hypothetical protein